MLWCHKAIAKPILNLLIGEVPSFQIIEDADIQKQVININVDRRVKFAMSTSVFVTSYYGVSYNFLCVKRLEHERQILVAIEDLWT